MPKVYNERTWDAEKGAYNYNYRKTCMTEGCGHVSHCNNFCTRCRHEQASVCLTEGCGRKTRSATGELCKWCRLPARCQKCKSCGKESWHNTAETVCVICRGWHSISTRNKELGRQMNLTKSEYMRVMLAATVCEDSGHVFDDTRGDKNLRKSLDRLDNTKGYSLDNVRVITYGANIMRGAIPLGPWRLAAAEMRAQNLW